MGWYRADVLGNRLLFTDRRGGVSAPPHDSLNLSRAEDDDPSAVEENRRRATEPLGVELPWVPIRQVHGAGVASRASSGPFERGTRHASEEIAADAVVLTSPGHVGAVLVADCAPVALVGEGGVAAVHAGWRGLVAGVVEAAAGAMRDLGVEPRRALVGPCIRPCCYEFGEDDLHALVQRFGPGVRSTTTGGSAALDLPVAVRVALIGAGVTDVSETGVCTSCSPGYFSYRRASSQGDRRAGRQGLLATVLP